MPNWCENELTIQIDPSGHPKERKKRRNALKRFMQHAYDPNDPDEHISAEMFMPTPKNLLKGDGWYDWRITNWGTKWGFCHTCPPENINEDKILYAFDTAWAPPIPLIIYMSGLYPEFIFTLKYWEAGCAFKGIFKIQNRNILNDKTYKYFGWRGG